MDNHAGNSDVSRRSEEEYWPNCISPTVKHSQSIIVWSRMATIGIGRLACP